MDLESNLCRRILFELSIIYLSIWTLKRDWQISVSIYILIERSDFNPENILIEFEYKKNDYHINTRNLRADRLMDAKKAYKVRNFTKTVNWRKRQKINKQKKKNPLLRQSP